jgi:hypothetical protein
MAMTKSQSGWILKKDGWHKTGSGQNHLTNHVFNQPEPVVRDDQGRPMASDRSSIDIARWIQEVNEKENSND